MAYRLKYNLFFKLVIQLTLTTNRKNTSSASRNAEIKSNNWTKKINKEGQFYKSLT